MFGLSWIDIIAGIILIVFFILGIKRGLIKEVTELLGLAGGLFCGVFFEDIFEPVVAKYLGTFPGIQIITFLIIFFIVAIFFILIGKLLGRFIKFMGLETTDKMLGGVFGMLKVLIGVILICMVLFIFDVQKINDYVTQSYTGKAVKYLLNKINYQEQKHEIKNIKLP